MLFIVELVSTGVESYISDILRRPQKFDPSSTLLFFLTLLISGKWGKFLWSSLNMEHEIEAL